MRAPSDLKESCWQWEGRGGGTKPRTESGWRPHALAAKSKLWLSVIGQGSVLSPDSNSPNSPYWGFPSYLGCTLFKTLDDFLFANSELERFVSVSGRIEFLSILEHSCESKNRMEKSGGHELTPSSGATCLKWNSYLAQTAPLPISPPVLLPKQETQILCSTLPHMQPITKSYTSLQSTCFLHFYCHHPVTAPRPHHVSPVCGTPSNWSFYSTLTPPFQPPHDTHDCLL